MMRASGLRLRQSRPRPCGATGTSVDASPMRCSGRAAANSDRYSASVAGVPSGAGGVRSCSSDAKNHGSLHVRHEDLRMAPEHLVEGGRAALGVPDDEEVRDPPDGVAPAGRARQRLAPHRCGSHVAARLDRRPVAIAEAER